MASSPSAELQYVKVFGPGANCTLDICPVEMSVYGYRPSLAANFTLLALYVVSALAHTLLGFRWKTYSFMAFMIVGAVNAVLGYAGRIMLYYNPFNFTAFMIQISESCHILTVFCLERKIAINGLVFQSALPAAPFTTRRPFTSRWRLRKSSSSLGILGSIRVEDQSHAQRMHMFW